MIIILLLSLLLQSCYGYRPDQEHLRQIDRITLDYCKEVKKKYDLYCCGGGGSMMYDVKLVSLHFDLIKNMNLEEARRLIVKRDQELHAKINADQGVRPYLHEYPFPSKGVEISIAFLNDKRRRVTDEAYIGWVSKIGDKIIYCKENLITDKLDVIHRETYEEALRIVQEEEQRDSWQ